MDQQLDNQSGMGQRSSFAQDMLYLLNEEGTRSSRENELIPSASQQLTRSIFNEPSSWRLPSKSQSYSLTTKKPRLSLGDHQSTDMSTFNGTETRTAKDESHYNKGQLPTQANTSHCLLAMTSPNASVDLGSSLWEPFSLEALPSAKDKIERFNAIIAFLELAASNPIVTLGDRRAIVHNEMKSLDEVRVRAVASAIHVADAPLVNDNNNAHSSTNNHSSSHRKRPFEAILETKKSYAEITDEMMLMAGGVEDDGTRLRVHQDKRWEDSFQELVLFQKEYGHCRVPHNFEKNLVLARWVKRQRNQYRLLQEGSNSTLSEYRLKALVDLGFVWHSHLAVWEDHFCELKEFRSIKGHCNVPSTFPANPQLSTWVKSQRRQYKLLVSNKNSTLTPDRVEKLNGIGFQWNVEGHKRILPAVATTQSQKVHMAYK